MALTAGILDEHDRAHLLRDLARQAGRPETIDFLNRVVRKQKRRHAIKALIDTTPVVGGMLPAVNRFRLRLRGEPAEVPTAHFIGGDSSVRCG